MRCTSLTLSRGAVHHWIIWLARMTHSGLRHRDDKIYDTIYDMSEREMERMGCIDSHDVTYLSDYSIIVEPESYAQITNTRK